MENDNGPALRRRQLGGVLRQMRNAKKLTIGEVAKELTTSDARVSRIENGATNVTLRLPELNAMLAMYGITDPGQISALHQMFRDSQRRTWWAGYEPVLPAGYSTVIGLETDATAERVWEPNLIPGLLQTPAYAQAVMATGKAAKRGDSADPLVDLRLERQQFLVRETRPLHLWTVIGQAALESGIGGPEVMHEQALRLIKATKMPNVKIQVMPSGSGAHPGINGPFTLLEAAAFPTVCYIETSEGTIYLEKSEDVQRYDDAFRELCITALDLSASLEFLHNLTKENPR